MISCAHRKTSLSALLLAVTATLAPASAAAQIRVAPRFTAEFSPIQRWTFSVSERYVYGPRIASSGRAQTYVGAEFSPWKWLDFGVAYRLSMETYRNAYWSSHRVTTDAGVAGSRWGFRLGYRLRWQNRFSPDRQGYEFDSALRNRVSLRYRTPKPVDLAVSGELFSTLMPAVLPWSAFRFEAEVTGRVDPVDITFGYRYHHPIQSGGQHYHMVMATVTWRWEAPRPRNRDREERRRNRENRENREGRSDRERRRDRRRDGDSSHSQDASDARDTQRANDGAASNTSPRNTAPNAEVPR